MTKAELEQRLTRAEAAISALAYFEGRFAAIPRGRCVELDEIRDEYAGRINGAVEQRPFSGLESREAMPV